MISFNKILPLVVTSLPQQPNFEAAQLIKNVTMNPFNSWLDSLLCDPFLEASSRCFSSHFAKIVNHSSTDIYMY